MAAYRVKRYPLAERDSDAVDSYVGGKFEQRFAGEQRLELGYLTECDILMLCGHPISKQNSKQVFERPSSWTGRSLGR